MANRPSRPAPGVQQSFIVRIWRGDGAGRPRPVPDGALEAATVPIVRGSVQLVGRDSIRYFTSLASLMQILADGADLPVDDASTT